MFEKIRLLLELQELDLILKEARIVHGGKKSSKKITKKVDNIRQKLDDGTLSRYDRLIRQGIGVVHEKSGMCLGCNLTIPVGDLNRIRSQKSEPICPHCGKFIVVSA